MFNNCPLHASIVGVVEVECIAEIKAGLALVKRKLTEYVLLVLNRAVNFG